MTAASSSDSAKLPGALSGVSVLVAGAGLAGLTAAYDLTAMGASVTVIEARDRVGGRVWTIRDGFADRQHAEAGGDMIDDAQDEIRQLASQLGLTLSRILRDGFGYMRSAGPNQPPRIVTRNAALGERVTVRTALGHRIDATVIAPGRVRID